MNYNYCSKDNQEENPVNFLSKFHIANAATVSQKSCKLNAQSNSIMIKVPNIKDKECGGMH
jgi:hypothetical protein